MQQSRLANLDILRALACFLVLGRHCGPLALVKGFPWKQTAFTWVRGGWSGVDLFFVLSGFLVSGLLFREYQLKGRVQVGRFLIRRAFKIHPAFYILLLVGVALHFGLVFHHWSTAVCDGLFLQNYSCYTVGTLWPHCWSLAVEEHFYLGLSVAVFVLAKVRRVDPFMPLAVLFVAASLGCLYFRAAAAAPDYFVPGGAHTYFPLATHMRFDALLFGVVLSYVYYFRPSWLKPFYRRKPLALAVSLALLAPIFCITSYNFFIVTLGMTMTYWGYGILLLVCVENKHAAVRPEGSFFNWRAALIAWRRENKPAAARPEGSLRRFVAWIGRYSYSIYLWHWLIVMHGGWLRYVAVKYGAWTGVAGYFAITIFTGVVMGKLIEMPFLHLRDRLFPSNVALAPIASSIEKPAVASLAA